MLVIPSFEGCHNWSKARVLLFLYALSRRPDYKYLNARVISQYTGLKSSSIWPLMWRLCRYRYTGSRTKAGVLCYSISKRGQHFVEDIIPEDVKKDIISDLTRIKAAVTKAERAEDKARLKKILAELKEKERQKAHQDKFEKTMGLFRKKILA